MKSLFETPDRESLLARLETLRPDSTAQWGRMNPAQMLCHCTRPLETATGERPMKQKFIGKVLAPFVRKGMLGDKPFPLNSPTDPTFVIKDERNFDAEKTRLIELVDRFVERGAASAAEATHSFFGRLTGEEWGRLMYKHVDHHLRQFGV